MAKANVMIDNQKTRVTEWTFEVGDETGQHIHEYDYVVVPMLDGELKIINHDGVETISKLKKGGSYFTECAARRLPVDAGVSHHHRSIIYDDEHLLRQPRMCLGVHFKRDEPA